MLIQISADDFDAQESKLDKEKYYHDAQINAYLDWEILGVGININSNRVQVYKDTAYIQITPQEALRLAQKLITAAQESLLLDIEYRDHIINESGKVHESDSFTNEF